MNPFTFNKDVWLLLEFLRFLFQVKKCSVKIKGFVDGYFLEEKIKHFLMKIKRK